MKPIRACIVDDELGALQALESIIKAESPEIEIVGSARNVADAHSMVTELEPELLFLDIQLRDQTGFDLLNMPFNHVFEVVFVTAYDEYAIQAFEKNALSYLLKPMSFEAFDRVKQRAIQVIRAKDGKSDSLTKARDVLKNRIAIPHASSIEYLMEEELVYAKADGSYCEIHLRDGRTKTLSKPLKFLSDCIDSSAFFRPHRSYLVNAAFIQKWDKSEGGNIVLRDGTSIPLSKEGRKTLAAFTS